MDNKIKITICTGTNCFVMGGAELLLLEENLSETLKNKVDIVGCTCMDICKDTSAGKAPFVKINDKIISQATIPKIIGVLEKMINESEEL